MDRNKQAHVKHIRVWTYEPVARKDINWQWAGDGGDIKAIKVVLGGGAFGTRNYPAGPRNMKKGMSKAGATLKFAKKFF